MTSKRNILLAIFDDRLEAEHAVDDLEQAHFKHDEIGFAIRGEDAIRGGMITDAIGTKDGSGAIQGAVTGGVAGGLLAAVVSLAIPGVGPVLAAGFLATFLGFAAAGSAVGGILGAMTGLELSEEEARFYEDQFRCGKAIVCVKGNSRALEAGDILKRHGGYDMQNCPTPDMHAHSSSAHM